MQTSRVLIGKLLIMAPAATETDSVPVTSKGTRPAPLKLSGVLSQFRSKELTPVIGTEFFDVNLVEWLNAPNADELLRDLAITGRPSFSLLLPSTLLTK